MLKFNRDTAIVITIAFLLTFFSFFKNYERQQ